MLGNLLGQGRKSEVYEYGDGTVIKLFFTTVSSAAVEEDRVASQLASNLGLPCPRVLGRETVNGREGIVFERVHGTALLHALMAGQYDIAEMATQFGALQAIANTQQTEGLPEYRDVLVRLLREAPEGWFTTEQSSRLEEHIRQLPEGDRLCHMDYHPDNVLVENGQLKIIDWALAVRGPAALDFAYSHLVLSSGDVPPGLTEHQTQLVTALRQQFFNAYVESYAAQSGISPESAKQYTLASQLFRLLFWQLEAEKAFLLPSIIQAVS